MPESKKKTCPPRGSKAKYCKEVVADDKDCVKGTIRTKSVGQKGVKIRTCRRRGAAGPRGGRTKILSILTPKGSRALGDTTAEHHDRARYQYGRVEKHYDAMQEAIKKKDCETAFEELLMTTGVYTAGRTEDTRQADELYKERDSGWAKQNLAIQDFLSACVKKR